MRKTLWVFVLLVVFGGPAVAESADARCLAAPTYDCLIADARAAAESEPDNGERASLLASMAGAQAMAGRREDAAETLKHAFSCASSIRDDWDREYFATLVIWAKAWMGKIEEAAVLAANIDDSYNSVFAWSSLTEAITGVRPRLAELEEVGDRDAMFAAISEMASLDLDKAATSDRADALATAAMALGRAGL